MGSKEVATGECIAREDDSTDLVEAVALHKFLLCALLLLHFGHDLHHVIRRVLLLLYGRLHLLHFLRSQHSRSQCDVDSSSSLLRYGVQILL